MYKTLWLYGNIYVHTTWLKYICKYGIIFKTIPKENVLKTEWENEHCNVYWLWNY